MAPREFQPNRHGGVGLVASYIEYIGEREPDNRPALSRVGKNDPHHASLLIGRGCLLLRNGNDRAADRIFRRVIDNTRPFVEKPDLRFRALGANAVQLHHTAVMLLHRNQPDAAEVFQQAAYQETIRDLQNTRTRLRGRIRSELVHRYLVGAQTENEALGLAMRGAGPGTLSVRALLHHDDCQWHSANYDLLVIDQGGGGQQQPTVGQAQLKKGCMAYCGRTQRRDVQASERGKYVRRTVMLSGCCDILKGTTTRVPVTRYLMDESDGAAPPEAVSALDERSLGLLQVVIEPTEERLGTRPDQPLPVYQPRAVKWWEEAA